MQEFISRNDKELRYLVTNICERLNVQSVDDIVQDVYLRFFTGQVIEKFDSTRYSSPKISTYLYRIIYNMVCSHVKSNNERIRRHSYQISDNDIESYEDDVELALRYNDVALEYQGILEQNQISEEMDSLGAELRYFKKNILTKKNKKYRLSKRRNKNVMTDGCDLVSVYQLLHEGLNNREIAKIYGISDMMVTNMKRQIGAILKRHGITWRGAKPKIRTRARNDRHKVSKVSRKSRNR